MLSNTTLKDDLIKGADRAAEYLGPEFNRNSVYYLVRTKRLPAKRLGSMLIFRRSALDAVFSVELEDA